MDGSQPAVTGLLERLGDGDASAEAELLPLLYDQLHGLAERAMRRERPGHTLQATALVHDAWMRLMGGGAPRDWNDRGHFFRVAARAMRNLLVDHARARRVRPGSSAVDLDGERIDALMDVYEDRAIDLLALHEALEALAALDPELARIVELRFFAGLSIDETARALAVSPSTVDRGWRTARAWLRARIPRPA